MANNVRLVSNYFRILNTPLRVQIILKLSNTNSTEANFLSIRELLAVFEVKFKFTQSWFPQIIFQTLRQAPLRDNDSTTFVDCKMFEKVLYIQHKLVKPTSCVAKLGNNKSPV